MENIYYYFEELGLTFLKLSYEQWAAIPEPTFFENSHAHHNGSIWDLFQKLDYCPEYVTQVKLIRVDGKLFKLDGKQQKMFWENIKSPDMLIAQVFDISEQALIELNNQSIAQTQGVVDDSGSIEAIYHDLGLTINSELLKKSSMKQALNFALRGRHREFQNKGQTSEREEINVRKAIAVFRHELDLVDELQPNPDIFLTGVLGGTLIMLGAETELTDKIHDFLVRLNQQQGEVSKEGIDPISLLLRAIYNFKNNPKLNKRSLANSLCWTTVQAIQFWLEGEDSPNYWRKRVRSGPDPKPLIRKMKQNKGIHGVVDL